MQELMAIMVYASAGYAGTYMVLRPQSFFDALAAGGPGMSAAGWEWHHKHWKLTYPLTLMMLVLLGVAVSQIPEAQG